LGNINRSPKTQEHREKIGISQRNVLKGPQTKEHRMNISLSKKGKKFSEEHKQNLSKSKIKTMQEKFVFGGKQEEYISLKTNERNFAHSSYEIRRMKFLDNDKRVIFWTKNHKIVIEYELCGVIRRYLPDFLIELEDGRKIIEEVKGWVRNKDVFDAKVKSAIEFAKKMVWNTECCLRTTWRKNNGCETF